MFYNNINNIFLFFNYNNLNIILLFNFAMNHRRWSSPVLCYTFDFVIVYFYHVTFIIRDWFFLTQPSCVQKVFSHTTFLLSKVFSLHNLLVVRLKVFSLSLYNPSPFINYQKQLFPEFLVSLIENIWKYVFELLIVSQTNEFNFFYFSYLHQ